MQVYHGDFWFPALGFLLGSFKMQLDLQIQVLWGLWPVRYSLSGSVQSVLACLPGSLGSGRKVLESPGRWPGQGRRGCWAPSPGRGGRW